MVEGFLIFASCYLETRPSEYSNVVKYVFLINELFLSGRGNQWREYDDKFRKHQDGNAVIPLGFKDVEVWLEVVGQAKKVADVQAKKPFIIRATASVRDKGKCFAFNAGKCVRGSKCRYKHTCQVCDGGHPAKECRASGRASQPSRGDAGGGAP